MSNISSLRLLDYFQLHSRTKLKQQYLGNRCYGRNSDRYNQQNTGFSLIELTVVLLLVGILAAIAAPGWLTFMNRQQINKANDAVLTAIQDAQSQAKQKKLSYSVSFQKNSTTKNVEVSIYPTKKGDGTNFSFTEITWKPIGTDVGVDSSKFLLGANLSSENTVNTAAPLVSYTLSTPAKITFDYMGTLTFPNDFGTAIAPSTEPRGLRIAVAIPTTTNSTSASSVKRCVIVKTLLGSMVAARDSECS
jgi:prepilin-type N-terminal cleavage/methylation domain-containing protein